ncbi:hypothetical protein C3N85_21930 [Salmonella enterica subsp. enterica serovar Morehead]|nr:hypothetical protein [Salmonella enterica subsp. enterica serovar Newport]EBY2753092.1 hypothetical protein [Salmonella enterica subsp. enterica serovar Kottbus]EEM2539459.1 hypothetical protein [Salmonella enterica subsp. enterica serovar Morehead]EHN5888777.1 hypothetical protein [Salmonella enterica subsp. enterica serovar Newport]
MDNTLPFTCQDSAATKVAYLFLASDKIDEQPLLQELPVNEYTP